MSMRTRSIGLVDYSAGVATFETQEPFTLAGPPDVNVIVRVAHSRWVELGRPVRLVVSFDIEVDQ